MDKYPCGYGAAMRWYEFTPMVNEYARTTFYATRTSTTSPCTMVRARRKTYIFVQDFIHGFLRSSQVGSKWEEKCICFSLHHRQYVLRHNNQQLVPVAPMPVDVNMSLNTPNQSDLQLLESSMDNEDEELLTCDDEVPETNSEVSSVGAKKIITTTTLSASSSSFTSSAANATATLPVQRKKSKIVAPEASPFKVSADDKPFFSPSQAFSTPSNSHINNSSNSNNNNTHNSTLNSTNTSSIDSKNKSSFADTNNIISSINKPSSIRRSGWSPNSNIKSSPAHVNKLYEDARNRAQKLDIKRNENMKKDAIGFFKPKLVSNRKSPSSTTERKGDAFERLHGNAKLTSEKINRIRESVETREAAIHTFKPKLLTTSSPMNKKIEETMKKSGESVVDRCFKRAETIKQKNNEYVKMQTKKECSFSPDLDKRINKKNTVGALVNSTKKKEKTKENAVLDSAALVNRLYDPKQQQEKIEERARRKKELEERECSYKPNINKGRKSLTTSHTTTTTTAKIEDGATKDNNNNGGKEDSNACLRLYQKANAENEKFKEWRGQQMKKYEKECTFSPKVEAPTSRRSSVTERLASQQNIFDRLYRKQHKVFKSAKDENLTFKPTITKKKISNPDVAALQAMPIEERFNYLYTKGVEKVAAKRVLPKDEGYMLRKKQEDEELKECTFVPKTTWKKIFKNLDDEEGDADYVGNIADMEEELGMDSGEHEYDENYDENYPGEDALGEETGVTTILGNLEDFGESHAEAEVFVDEQGGFPVEQENGDDDELEGTVEAEAAVEVEADGVPELISSGRNNILVEETEHVIQSAEEALGSADIGKEYNEVNYYADEEKYDSGAGVDDELANNFVDEEQNNYFEGIDEEQNEEDYDLYENTVDQLTPEDEALPPAIVSSDAVIPPVPPVGNEHNAYPEGDQENPFF